MKPFEQVERAKLEWEATVDVLTQIICLVDEHGDVLRINRGIERWNLGRVQDAVGRSFHQVLHHDCTDSDCIFRHIWVQSNTEVDPTSRIMREVYDEVLQKHLRVRISWEVNTATQNGGISPYAVIVVEDITEKKEIEAALRRSEAHHRQLAQNFRALHHTSMLLNAETDTNALLALIIDTLTSLIHADSGTIWRYDAENDLLRMAYVTPANDVHDEFTLAPDEGLIGRVFQAHTPTMVSESELSGERVSGFPLNSAGSVILAIPLAAGTRQLGVAVVTREESKQEFCKYEVQLGRLFAAQAAIALNQAGLYAHAKERAREVEALYAAAQAMTSSLDLDEVLQRVISEVRHLQRADQVSLLLYEPDWEMLRFAAVVGDAADTLAGVRLSADDGIAGWVFRHKNVVCLDDARQDARFSSRFDRKTGFVTRSLLAVPLLFQDEALGVIEVLSEKPNVFQQKDIDMLEALAASAAIAIQNANLHEAEQRRLRELRQSQARLVQSEKLAALGRLTASITHEINNPLQAIQSCLSLMHENLHTADRDQDELETYIDIVDDEIARITSVTRRLRDFYRPIDGGMLEVEDADAFYLSAPVRTIDPHDLIQNVLILIQKELEKNSIEIVVDIDPDIPALQVRGDSLRQVFLNLIFNAINAMTPGGGTLSISAGVESPQAGSEQEPGIVFDVSDTGIGMSEEIQRRIFEPFFTTKEGGSGVGLPTAYQIVQAHAGMITVSSEPGDGTTFRIYLPFEQTDAEY